MTTLSIQRTSVAIRRLAHCPRSVRLLTIWSAEMDPRTMYMMMTKRRTPSSRSLGLPSFAKRNSHRRNHSLSLLIHTLPSPRKTKETISSIYLPYSVPPQSATIWALITVAASRPRYRRGQPLPKNMARNLMMIIKIGQPLTCPSSAIATKKNTRYSRKGENVPHGYRHLLLRLWVNPNPVRYGTLPRRRSRSGLSPGPDLSI